MKIRLEEESKLFPEWETKKTTFFFVFCRFEDSAAYLWVGQSVVFFCGEG